MSILKEIANQINGSEYPFEPSEGIQSLAKENNIVIVFGSSDDLMELRGVIYDVESCYDGGTFVLDRQGFVPITPDGEFKESCHPLTVDGAKQLIKRFERSVYIKAIWCSKDVNASWVYELDGHTQFEHETFDVMEDGALYCQGVVFQLP